MRKKIEMIRFGQGLSKSDLCDKAGISEGTYYRFIKGKDISLSTLESIMSVLGCKLEITGGFDE